MFSKRLVELRKKRGLSVKEVAIILNIPVSTYRSWEEGARIIGEEAYIKIAFEFNVSLAYLLSGKQGDLYLTNESAKELMDHLQIVKKTVFSIEKVIASRN